MADGSEDEAKAAPPQAGPTTTFLFVDGKHTSQIGEVRRAVRGAGLEIASEFRLHLNHVEARRFLAAAGPAMEKALEDSAAAAAAAAAEKEAAAAAAKGKGKKGKAPEPEPAETGEDDDDGVPPRKPFDPTVRQAEVKCVQHVSSYGIESMHRG